MQANTYKVGYKMPNGSHTINVRTIVSTSPEQAGKIYLETFFPSGGLPTGYTLDIKIKE